MATQQRTFQFLFPLTRIHRIAQQLNIRHTGDLLVTGVATCSLVPGQVCDEIRFTADIAHVYYQGRDILGGMQLAGQDLLADLRIAATEHAKFVYNHIDPIRRDIGALDPVECFRAGAASFASSLLLELDAGKAIPDVKAMCREVIDGATATGYWKSRSAA